MRFLELRIRSGPRDPTPLGTVGMAIVFYLCSLLSVEEADGVVDCAFGSS